MESALSIQSLEESADFLDQMFVLCAPSTKPPPWLPDANGTIASTNNKTVQNLQMLLVRVAVCQTPFLTNDNEIVTKL